MWVRSLCGEGPLEGGVATYPLQYSCLENTMNRGSCTVPMGVTKSQTRLKQLNMQARTHLAQPSSPWLIPRVAVTLQPNSQSLRCDMDLPTSVAL